MLLHLRQEHKKLGKIYTRAYLSRFMQREGLRKILRNAYKIWRTVESYKILQDLTASSTKPYTILFYFSQESMGS